MRVEIPVIFAVLLFMGGCSSGLSCKNTMGGTRCANIQTVYEQTVLGAEAIPEFGEKAAQEPEGKRQIVSKPLTEKEQIVSHLAGNNSRPIRIPTVILRIWTAPWEDQDGDLHQSGYVYSEINEKRGRWLFGETAVESGYDVHRPAVEAPKVDLKETAPTTAITPTPKQPVAQGARAPYGVPQQENNTLKLAK